jgi:hypothetical protein
MASIGSLPEVPFFTGTPRLDEPEREVETESVTAEESAQEEKTKNVSTKNIIEASF